MKMNKDTQRIYLNEVIRMAAKFDITHIEVELDAKDGIAHVERCHFLNQWQEIVPLDKQTPSAFKYDEPGVSLFDNTVKETGSNISFRDLVVLLVDGIASSSRENWSKDHGGCVKLSLDTVKGLYNLAVFQRYISLSCELVVDLHDLITHEVEKSQ